MTSLLKTSRKHDIAFYASGRIDISAHLARLLSLAPGDVVDIVEENREWYMCVKLRSGNYAGRHEGKVYATTRRGKGTFRTWSRTFAAAALKASGQTARLRCPCGEVVERDGKVYVTIIYACSL